MTAAFGADELDLLDEEKTVHIETRSSARTYRTIIWVVIDGEAIYVRSYLGKSGRWYQRALTDPEVAIIAGDARIAARAVPVADGDTIAAVSRAFVTKYGTNPWVDAMVVAEVLDTTLRLDPVVG